MTKWNVSNWRAPIWTILHHSVIWLDNFCLWFPDMQMSFEIFILNTLNVLRIQYMGTRTTSLQVTQEVSGGTVEDCQTGPWKSGQLHKYVNSLPSYLREGETEGQDGPDPRFPQFRCWPERWGCLRFQGSRKEVERKESWAKCTNVGTKTTCGGATHLRRNTEPQICLETLKKKSDKRTKLLKNNQCPQQHRKSHSHLSDFNQIIHRCNKFIGQNEKI